MDNDALKMIEHELAIKELELKSVHKKYRDELQKVYPKVSHEDMKAFMKAHSINEIYGIPEHIIESDTFTIWNSKHYKQRICYNSFEDTVTCDGFQYNECGGYNPRYLVLSESDIEKLNQTIGSLG